MDAANLPPLETSSSGQTSRTQTSRVSGSVDPADGSRNILGRSIPLSPLAEFLAKAEDLLVRIETKIPSLPSSSSSSSLHAASQSQGLTSHKGKGNGGSRGKEIQSSGEKAKDSSSTTAATTGEGSRRTTLRSANKPTTSLTTNPSQGTSETGKSSAVTIPKRAPPKRSLDPAVNLVNEHDRQRRRIFTVTRYWDSQVFRHNSMARFETRTGLTWTRAGLDLYEEYNVNWTGEGKGKSPLVVDQILLILGACWSIGSSETIGSIAETVRTFRTLQEAGDDPLRLLPRSRSILPEVTRILKASATEDEALEPAVTEALETLEQRLRRQLSDEKPTGLPIYQVYEMLARNVFHGYMARVAYRVSLVYMAVTWDKAMENAKGPTNKQGVTGKTLCKKELLKGFWPLLNPAARRRRFKTKFEPLLGYGRKYHQLISHCGGLENGLGVLALLPEDFSDRE